MVAEEDVFVADADSRGEYDTACLQGHSKLLDLFFVTRDYRLSYISEVHWWPQLISCSQV